MAETAEAKVEKFQRDFGALGEVRWIDAIEFVEDHESTLVPVPIELLMAWPQLQGRKRDHRGPAGGPATLCGGHG